MQQCSQMKSNNQIEHFSKVKSDGGNKYFSRVKSEDGLQHITNRKDLNNYTVRNRINCINTEQQKQKMQSVKKFKYIQYLKNLLENKHVNKEITFLNKSYFVDYENKQYRDSIKKVFSENLNKPYEWFKEDRGSNNWVLYRADLFTVKTIKSNTFEFINLFDSNDYDKDIHYLEYRNRYVAEVEVPINMSSSFMLFRNKVFNDKSKFIDNHNNNLDEVFDTVAMFFNCTFEVGFCLSDLINTKNSVNMNGMFYGALFKDDSHLSDGFSTENVISMSCMFHRAELHKNFLLPIGFNTKNVIDMSKMFKDASMNGNVIFKCDYLSSNNDFFNTSNVINFEEMFAYLRLNERLILPKGFTITNALYTRHMFYGSHLYLNINLNSYTNKEIINILKEV